MNPTQLRRQGPILAAAALTVLAALRLAGRLTRLRVVGASMEPTLWDGDRVVAVRAGTIGPGHVVALRDPRQPTRLLVKRVARVGAEGVTVLGDRPDASTDSRTFGPVAADAVVGRVRYRYAPRERAGPLPGPATGSVPRRQDPGPQ